MTMKAVRFVGLDRDVWLPADIVVEIAIVPASVRNVRSNQRETGQTTFTQHETANFNRGANADMHKRWLHGGASGSYVGFNFVVDDRKIIQLTPLNEITWAAGTPNGNRYSYHSELCVNSDIDHNKARRNAAALAGGILAARGWDTSKLIQHNYWTGKDCPYLLRRNNLWPQYVNQVSIFVTQARNGGVAPKPSQPTPPTNSDVEIVNGIKFTRLAKGTRFRLSAATNVREWASIDSKIIRTLPAGAIIEPTHEVQAESVSGVAKWFVLDGINKPGRVWSGTATKL